MLPDNVNPSGAQILPCDEDEACEVVSCSVCLAEVPVSVAESFEGPDYVQHFCGLDCLEQWRKQTNKKAK